MEVKKKLSNFLHKYGIIILEEGEEYIKVFLEKRDDFIKDNLITLFNKKIIFETKNNLLSKNISTSFYNLKNLTNSNKKIEEIASEAPIVKLLNDILDSAIVRGATDVHIEPFDNYTEIKFRIDGMLYPSFYRLPKYVHYALVSRIKILSKLDIAEKRIPQDGKFIHRKDGREYDIRVSILPTIYGESIVLRILKKGDIDFSLKDLGFSSYHIEMLKNFIQHSYGMILVTGPTGSGKTTTLYSLIKELNDGKKKIITVEDPVEYTIPGIVQVQVNNKIGLTFARALRTILRQDPDVIMVGEIRDIETAEIAIRAALTGHLVLATLHTNDAISAFTRLIDMGIEEFLISSAIIGVISQRLVRKICDNCKVAYNPSSSEKELFKKNNINPPDKLFKGEGCNMCQNSGYKGRTVIAEVLKVDDELREAIAQKRTSSEIKAIASRANFRPLIVDGLEKVKKGVTTLSEVVRVLNN